MHVKREHSAENEQTSPRRRHRIWRALPFSLRLFFTGFIIVAAAVALSLRAEELSWRWLEFVAVALGIVGLGFGASAVVAECIRVYRVISGR